MTYKPVAITGRLLSVPRARCKALRVGRENALNRRGNDRSLHVGQFTSLGAGGDAQVFWIHPHFVSTHALAPACQDAVQRQLVLETLGRKRTAIQGFPPCAHPTLPEVRAVPESPHRQTGEPFNSFPGKAITSSHPASGCSYLHGQRPSPRPSNANDKGPPDIPTGLCLFRLICEVRSS